MNQAAILDLGCLQNNFPENSSKDVFIDKVTPTQLTVATYAFSMGLKFGFYFYGS